MFQSVIFKALYLYPKRYDIESKQCDEPIKVEEIIGPPGWCSGLWHCIAVLAVPPGTLGLSPGSVAASRDREVQLHQNFTNYFLNK